MCILACICRLLLVHLWITACNLWILKYQAVHTNLSCSFTQFRFVLGREQTSCAHDKNWILWAMALFKHTVLWEFFLCISIKIHKPGLYTFLLFTISSCMFVTKLTIFLLSSYLLRLFVPSWIMWCFHNVTVSSIKLCP